MCPCTSHFPALGLFLSLKNKEAKQGDVQVPSGSDLLRIHDTLLRCGGCPSAGRGWGKASPPCQLFPLVEIASEMGTGAGQT